MKDQNADDEETSGNGGKTTDDTTTSMENWERLARRELSTRMKIDFNDMCRLRMNEFADALNYDSEESTTQALGRLSDAERAHREWLEEVLQDLVTAGVFSYDDPEFQLLQNGAGLMDDLSTLAAASARDNIEGPTYTPGTDTPTADVVLDNLQQTKRDLANARPDGVTSELPADAETLQDALADGGPAVAANDTQGAETDATDALADSERETVGRCLSELAHDWEREGYDREGVAAMLEEFADVVRDGHTELPERRGEWWQEVHGDDQEAEK